MFMLLHMIIKTKNKEKIIMIFKTTSLLTTIAILFIAITSINSAEPTKKVKDRFSFLEEEANSKQFYFVHPTTAEIARHTVAKKPFKFIHITAQEIEKIPIDKLVSSLYEYTAKLVFGAKLVLAKDYNPQTYHEFYEKTRLFQDHHNWRKMEGIKTYIDRFSKLNETAYAHAIVEAAYNNASAVFNRYYNDGILIKTYKQHVIKLKGAEAANSPVLMYWFLTSIDTPTSKFPLMADKRIIILDYSEEFGFDDSNSEVLSYVSEIVSNKLTISLDYMQRIYNSMEIATRGKYPLIVLRTMVGASERCENFALSGDCDEVLAWIDLAAKFINLAQVRARQ